MIYIVTAVHNRFAITESFVHCLLKQTVKDIRLVLVDDGCTDGTSHMVYRLMPSAVVLKGNGNLYWAGGLNLAYQWLSVNSDDNDYILFANDDTYFDEDYIQIAIGYLDKYKTDLITGCGYGLQSGKQIDGVVKWNFKDGTSSTAFLPNDIGNCASTRSLFMMASTMKKLGKFHPILLPHYGSDYEWTLRARKKGIHVRSFSNLAYKCNENTTGDNNINSLTLKKLFSKRSNKNPIYRLNFVILSTPAKFLPHHLCCQIKRYAKKILTLPQERKA